jgi:nuclear transcription factor Y, gamma
MNGAQIAALSRIQAEAIVNARNKGNSTLTPAQLATAISLQSQALVHAHTQAQIAAGIYKGDAKDNSAASASNAAAGTSATSSASAGPSQSMAAQQSHSTSSIPSPMPPLSYSTEPTPMAIDTDPGSALIASAPQPNSNSPQFLAQLNGSLNQFWQQAYTEIQALQNQTEHDFKNHNDLPLARIKRIMKSDEDVRMISAEAPVLFAKACELFILDLSIRSWNYSQLHKRRTLQKEDVKEAIQKTDIFDFLVDVIH